MGRPPDHAPDAGEDPPRRAQAHTGSDHPFQAPPPDAASGIPGSDLPRPQPAGGTSGIPGSDLPGPYPVGEYAAALRRRLRSFQRVQLIGEMVNLRLARARAYFELRDGEGAVPCAVWRDDWERIVAAAGTPQPGEGMQVVVAGGCDYYPGSATASPSFSFSVSDLRTAGEGDLLARIERLRRTLHAEGLLERQQRLRLAPLPRTIGVVCAEGGKARQDILAALDRRGWAGRLVWAFAPVQDRHAAPAIAQALQDLAATGEVDVAIVARGGGSLADLMCFCEETLCRTVAMLAIPVVSSVGHHTDRTLLDDVAAVSSSTPTHAAEAAVAIDCKAARRELASAAVRMRAQAGRAVLTRARAIAASSRAPGEHLRRQRAGLHQRMREARAAAGRRLASEQALSARRAGALSGKARGAIHACRRVRAEELRALTLALDAHDPQRTLQRGYVLVESQDGRHLASAAAASRERELRLRFADATIGARLDASTADPNAGTDPGRL